MDFWQAKLGLFPTWLRLDIIHMSGKRRNWNCVAQLLDTPRLTSLAAHGFADGSYVIGPHGSPFCTLRVNVDDRQCLACRLVLA